MDGKIGLEEHFSFDDTIEDSNGFLDSSIWPELKSRLMDFHGKRLGFMDQFGMEMIILSLNAPAIQAIPDPSNAIEVAKRSNDLLAEQVQKHPRYNLIIKANNFYNSIGEIQLNPRYRPRPLTHEG